MSVHKTTRHKKQRKRFFAATKKHTNITLLITNTATFENDALGVLPNKAIKIIAKL